MYFVHAGTSASLQMPMFLTADLEAAKSFAEANAASIFALTPYAETVDDDGGLNVPEPAEETSYAGQDEEFQIGDVVDVDAEATFTLDTQEDTSAAGKRCTIADVRDSDGDRRVTLPNGTSDYAGERFFTKVMQDGTGSPNPVKVDVTPESKPALLIGMPVTVAQGATNAAGGVFPHSGEGTLVPTSTTRTRLPGENAVDDQGDVRISFGRGFHQHTRPEFVTPRERGASSELVIGDRVRVKPGAFIGKMRVGKTGVLIPSVLDPHKERGDVAVDRDGDIRVEFDKAAEDASLAVLPIRHLPVREVERV